MYVGTFVKKVVLCFCENSYFTVFEIFEYDIEKWVSLCR